MNDLQNEPHSGVAACLTRRFSFSRVIQKPRSVALIQRATNRVVRDHVLITQKPEQIRSKCLAVPRKFIVFSGAVDVIQKVFDEVNLQAPMREDTVKEPGNTKHGKQTQGGSPTTCGYIIPGICSTVSHLQSVKYQERKNGHQDLCRCALQESLETRKFRLLGDPQLATPPCCCAMAGSFLQGVLTATLVEGRQIRGPNTSLIDPRIPQGRSATRAPLRCNAACGSIPE